MVLPQNNQKFRASKQKAQVLQVHHGISPNIREYSNTQHVQASNKT